MALVRWQPFSEMETVQREMNRLFEEVMAPATSRNGVGLVFTPAAELAETADSYQLNLEVPGIEANDINVEVTAEAVFIKGDRKVEKRTEMQGVSRSEFCYDKFQRVIPLPGRINNQSVSADYKNGVLQLTLAKAEEEKNKVVKVNIN